jgi:propionyl-CoA synthetase
MTNYADFHRRSIEDREGFWSEQAKLVDWQTPPQQVCDYSNPPFAKWFVGGTTNLCHNAVDRHLKDRADQAALIFVSTETNQEKVYTFRELHTEVQRMAAVLKDLGVQKGDRVLIYMPMIPEAAFAMLACTRLGAIHSVVFGGFASGALASRIEDSAPPRHRQRRWRPARRQGGGIQAAAGRGHPPLGAQAGIRAAGRSPGRAHAPG